jgi:hypothetical protein
MFKRVSLIVPFALLLGAGFVALSFTLAQERNQPRFQPDCQALGQYVFNKQTGLSNALSDLPRSGGPSNAAYEIDVRGAHDDIGAALGMAQVAYDLCRGFGSRERVTK